MARSILPEFWIEFPLRYEDGKFYLKIGKIDILNGGCTIIFDSCFPALTYPVKMQAFDFVPYQTPNGDQDNSGEAAGSGRP